jgi:imidazole glycerol phosphate synthase subunit HisF
VSTHSVEEAQRAAAEGADFVVFGPVFTTPSKMAYGPPQGLQQLAAVVHHLSIPVLAIGGIELANLPQVMSHGAYGVAMIRAVLAAPDAGEAARQLHAALAASGVQWEGRWSRARSFSKQHLDYGCEHCVGVDVVLVIEILQEPVSPKCTTPSGLTGALNTAPNHASVRMAIQERNGWNLTVGWGQEFVEIGVVTWCDRLEYSRNKRSALVTLMTLA